MHEVVKAIRGQLSNWEGNLLQPSLKSWKGYRKIYIKLIRDIDVENMPVRIENDPSISYVI